MKEESKIPPECRSDPGYRPAIAVILLLFGCVTATLLAAPLLYNALILLARQSSSMTALRDLEFMKVVSRMVVGMVALGFLPALWFGGVRTSGHLGLACLPGWKGEFARGLGSGMLLILIPVGVLVVTGVYAIRPGSIAGIPAQIPAAFFAGIFVAFFEETLFRGVLFGSLRKPLGVVGAALLSSTLFSLVHFVNPVPRPGIAHAHIYSGFGLLPGVFSWDHAPGLYVPAVFTLFFIGLALCFFYIRFRSLWFGVGLHMGWVWCLLSMPDLVQKMSRVPGNATVDFTKGPVACLVALALLVVAGLIARRSSPEFPG